MNRPLLKLLQQVAAGEIGPAVATRAQAIVDSELCRRRHRLKKSLPRRQAEAAAERELEEVSDQLWDACLARTLADHLEHACELCDKPAAKENLEPHHLEMGSGVRLEQESVRNVMAVCRTCHDAIHMSVRAFVAKVRAWCLQHLYPMPRRKEFR